MKKLYILAFSFLLVFLISDSRAYYYGYGLGIFSRKIPESAHVKILFAGSDLGNQGMIIQEDNIGGIYLIHASKDFPTIVHYLHNPHKNKAIFVKKVLGYYFDKNTFIVKIISMNDEISYIKIGYFLFECHQFDGAKMKYIDLDKSIKYFKNFKNAKNLFFLAFVISTIIALIKLARKSHKNM